MKRYTGQKALYEAISRSRAKAKRGNILERLLPDSAQQEKEPVSAGLPPADPTRSGAAGLTEAPAEPPAAKEPSRPVWERLYEAVAGPENAELQQIEKVEAAEMPAQEPAVSPVVKEPPNAKSCVGDPEPWAVEEADLPAPASPIGSAHALKRVGRAIPMWWRLKPLQLNEGRVEISVSYHVALAVALVVMLVILAGFRLGQRYPGAKGKEPVPTHAPARAAPPDAVTTAAAEKTPPAGAQGAGSPAGEPAQPQGDNWIVLARHKNEADLEPVVAHFAKSGIALKIYELGWLRQQLSVQGLTAAGLPSGDGFLLVTSDFYVNPQSPGTEGYKMIQKIASVGATYKAPRGRDPFTTNLFKDAYGMKISRVR